LLFLVANIIWFVEHKRNPEQFPKNYFKGVREAFWFVSVTTTTVGYGDKVPVTGTGRFITYLWMWISLAITSSITAGLVTTFTLALTQQPAKELSNLQDLQNKKVALLAGSSYFMNLTAEYKGLPKNKPFILKNNNHSRSVGGRDRWLPPPSNFVVELILYIINQVFLFKNIWN
jgi:hypothetical protein